MKLITLILLIILIIGCFSPNPKFGMAFNEERTKLGLQELPDHWNVSSVEGDFTIWINPDADRLLDQKRPVFFSKTVSYLKDEPVFESDLYYSGKQFETIDGHISESVTTTFYFSPYELGNDTIKGWHCRYTGPGQKSDVYENQFFLLIETKSLTQIDSTLKSWGIKNNLKVSVDRDPK